MGTMATGISQRLLLCWWCPQKNRGANWLCLWDRPVFIALVATSAALNFIRKGKQGGSHVLLLAQSLCEIHCQFVYPIQNRPCLGEKCLFVVQTLIKILNLTFCFHKQAVCVCVCCFIHYLYLCNFDYFVYVYCKHPLSCEAWQWRRGRGDNCCMPGRGCCCFRPTGCCCFDQALIPLSHLLLLLLLFGAFLAELAGGQSSVCSTDQGTVNNNQVTNVYFVCACACVRVRQGHT